MNNPKIPLPIDDEIIISLRSILAALELTRPQLRDSDSVMISIIAQNECLRAIAIAKGALK